MLDDSEKAALHAADHLPNEGATWSQTRHAFEAITSRPDASDTLRSAAAVLLLIAATDRYELGDDEIQAVLVQLDDDLRLLSKVARSASLISACEYRPALAKDWLPEAQKDLAKLDQEDAEVKVWTKRVQRALLRVADEYGAS
ncbi:hypothetical protein [Haliangium ochraceum]|uniref:Uncharacterized protein n=1 Tax=Haliangium ochraceum (strain DSM 14365 / JCM 11303 / SMP-2) TaxID=502025 RepID=D0LGT7_HALO1|nr:hypothetical protein [Haliangium ochraceum]ACY14659.1 hypothetical protein Hoch_2114 [Haliangium ochraceum DSM 14365]